MYMMNCYIIIRGPLGCGKTTISKKLSKAINGRYISIDKILDKHNLTKYKENGYISQKAFIKVNDIIIQDMEKFLNKGIPIIIDGNFYWRSQITDIIKRLSLYPHYVFTLKTSLETCLKRDNTRKECYGKNAVEAVYKKSIEFDYGISIDVTKSLDASMKKIFSHLKNR